MNIVILFLILFKHGFEIGLHNVGSGDFKREEIIQGINLFFELFGQFPKIHINHSTNKDNLYWGDKRYGQILNAIIKLLYGKKRRYYGDEPTSKYYWGDYSKKHVKYIRNRVFNGINTLKYDERMPYMENSKKYSNYWFSSSDGHTIEEFNALLSKQNINKLKQEKGLCIVYTHFASGFVDNKGNLNSEFEEKIEYLSNQNGWFAPASDILDFLLEKNGSINANQSYINKLDMKWLFDRVWKKLKYGR